MDMFQVLRIYWPAISITIVTVVVSLVLAQIGENRLAFTMFPFLHWVPVIGLGLASGCALWVTFRLHQAERGVGLMCPTCCGPLGIERDGRYGNYRKCLACGRNANERHYR